jgi:hypothetical protein
MLARVVALSLLVGSVFGQGYPSGAGTVYLSNSALVFKAGAMDPSGVAWGNFTDQVTRFLFGRPTVPALAPTAPAALPCPPLPSPALPSPAPSPLRGPRRWTIPMLAILPFFD